MQRQEALLLHEIPLRSPRSFLLLRHNTHGTTEFARRQRTISLHLGLLADSSGDTSKAHVNRYPRFILSASKSVAWDESRRSPDAADCSAGNGSQRHRMRRSAGQATGLSIVRGVSWEAAGWYTIYVNRANVVDSIMLVMVGSCSLPLCGEGRVGLPAKIKWFSESF